MTKSQALHKLIIVIGVLFILIVTLQTQAAPLHHHIQVEILPGLKILKAQDTLTFPKNSPRKTSFLLHKDLRISTSSSDDTVTLLHAGTSSQPYSEYGLQLGSQDNKATLHYYGVLKGNLISSEGSVLTQNSYWYPVILGIAKSFDITAQTPADWHSIVQGQLTSTQVDNGIRKTRFVEIYQQEDIYLFSGPFSRYEKEFESGLKVQVLLRLGNASLAQKIFSEVASEIKKHEQNVGRLLRNNFTVAESLWSSEYSIPGVAVVNLHNLQSSFYDNPTLAQMIAQSWWGHGVYVNKEQTDWSQGLSYYMSTYLTQKELGNDRPYRQSLLLNLNTAEAKSVFFYHMLEFWFGSDLFLKSLKDFYKENLFKKASYQDLQQSFEKVTKLDLQPFFKQWLEREDVPEIDLEDVTVMELENGGYKSTYMISQNQSEPFDIFLPVIWTLESGEEIKQLARLTRKSMIFSMESNSRPTKISIDPEFHILRKFSKIQKSL